MAEPRPGAALAASLQQTAQQLTSQEQMASRKVTSVVSAEKGSGSPAPQLAAQLRRLEQQIEMERRQVERRLDKMERRIEEVAAANASSGRWAELQGHVDGLEESLQNLIRGRSIEVADQAQRTMPGGSPAGRLSDMDDQMLQISHRLLRLEHSLQGDNGDTQRLQPQDSRIFKDEVQEVLGQMERFKGDWQEQMEVLEDQVGDMGQCLEDMRHELQEMMDTREAQDQVDSLGQRSWRLAMTAKQVTSGAMEAELRQELSTISEDLTSLFMRVEEGEVGLYSLADAMTRVCEELSHLKAPSLASVTQPQTPGAQGFAGSSIVADPPS